MLLRGEYLDHKVARGLLVDRALVRLSRWRAAVGALEENHERQ